MTTDQIISFCLLAAVFGLLIWGRFRYDVVAFGALVVAVLAGVVPGKEAFSGFGHPATIIVALVLIVSRGLQNSGAVELLTAKLVSKGRGLAAHIAVMSGIGAALSALMNNVAALALLMPVDVQAAKAAKRSPGSTLMPLSFATILGGMVTLIGTPPNIVVSEYRNDALGSPFQMFDYAPVGLACAVMGIIFVTVGGWRLIPKARREGDKANELFDLKDYVAEVEVGEGATPVGQTLADLEGELEEQDAAVVGLLRNEKRQPGLGRYQRVAAGDILVVEGSPEAIEKLVGHWRLKYLRREEEGGRKLVADDTVLREVVVPRGSRIEGRSALSLSLLARHGVTLLGISREGRNITERVRRAGIQAGDVLLLLSTQPHMQQVITWLGCLPLAERGLQVVQREKALITIGLFLSGIVVAGFGLVYLPIVLAAVAILLVLMNIVPVRQIYDSVEWPVVVLLGSMIPIGSALEANGGTALIAESIVSLAAGLPPIYVLAILLIGTMTLSDVMNNTATAVIAAPIAVNIATDLGVNPDPFLMAVAVAASCAFLTPIGHKNNTLILGPGGYRFSDYWRMGLPLEILIVAISVPMIAWVWPF